MPITEIESTATAKYVVAMEGQTIATPEQQLFDLPITVQGWKEIRVWVCVSASTPITSTAKLELHFQHGTSQILVDYEKELLPWNGVGSHISGYAIKPVIGKSIHILCRPIGMPAGPYTLNVTYLLVK